MVYCSDVAGAFDKVEYERLIAKMRAKGLAEPIVRVLSSWLRNRLANVIVGGKESTDQVLRDMVFQGTVLGSGLWNLMYEDARRPITKCNFTEVIYADDLNCYRAFRLNVANSVLKDEASKCQEELHAWGRCNRVQFDPAKESVHVIGRHDSEGSNFRILGIEFDCKLLMASAVRETTAAASWKVRSILRTVKFFTTTEVITHYKSHVLSFVEYRTAGIYHACCSTLKPLDKIQTRFLREMGMTEVEALFAYNLAPLRSRRDIAMLGLIHRAVLGCGPGHFQQFFRRDLSEKKACYRTRRQKRRHDKQLVEQRGPSFSEQLRRSALGLVAVYNLLPQDMVDSPSVKVFQSQLQALLRDHASHVSDWSDLFSPRIPLYKHPLLLY